MNQRIAALRTHSTLLGSLSIATFIVVIKFATDTTNHIRLPAQMQDFITLSLSVFIEAFPFLILGSILAAAVTVYVPPHFFHEKLPRRPVTRRLSLSVLGFLFPVCECGNVPLSRSLLMQGLRPSEAITFLLAAPVLNPITIWSTMSAFSNDMTIVISRTIATLLIANMIGFVISLRKPETIFVTESFLKLCTAHTSTKTARNSRGLVGIPKLATAFVHEAMIMIKMLAFGALIAGAVQSFVSRDVLAGIGSNIVLSIVAMLVLAFVVSICATVDAFFALSFAATFTAGSLVSFLVFGPMIDIKMLTLLRTTFTTELLITITVAALLLSGLTGLVVTYAF